MSRASVKTAAGQYFGNNVAITEPDGAGGTITIGYGPSTLLPGLGTIYLDPPKEFPATDFMRGQASGAINGAMAVTRIDTDRESRAAYGGGPSGRGIKRHAYLMTLCLYHLSYEDTVRRAAVNFDAMCEAVNAAMRADPTWGARVYSAGEGDLSNLAGQGSLIEWRIADPQLSAERIESYGECSFVVVEYITG